MTSDYLQGLAEKVSRTNWLEDVTDIQFSSLNPLQALYSEVPFSQVKTSYGDAIECRRGFSDAYERPGRYCTLADIRNISHVGIGYGKNIAVGMKPRWNPVVNAIHVGYPKKAVLWDDEGYRYISLKDNNTSPLPKDGAESSEWGRFAPRPRFWPPHGPQNWGKPDMRPYLLKLDAMMPKSPTTTRLMVRKFTGREIGLSGVMIFTPGFKRRTSSPYYTEAGNILDLQPDKSNVIASVSMKISPYGDIYENDEHADSYLEVFSQSRMYIYGGDSIDWPVFKSPHRLIPISADTTYYLYIEFENACITRSFWDDSPNNQDIYLICYTFARALEWPGAPLKY